MMLAKFEYWQSEVDGQWYFHFISPNGGIVVQSAGYESEEECLQGIDLLRSYSDIAVITQPDVDISSWI
jgi:uncharacterized protein YegP (UPF0339 family)